VPLPMPNWLVQFAGFTRFVIQRVDEDRCLAMAGSLAFTTLLSLVPLITIALTVVSAFPGFAALTGAARDLLFSYMLPGAASEIVSRYVQEFSQNAARLTALGIASLAVTAIATMLTIDESFNAIWGVRRQRPLLQRVLIYWAALTFGPILIGLSVSVTSYVESASLGWAQQVPGVSRPLLILMTLLLATLAFSLLYVIVPNRHVPAAHALVAGFAAAVGFAIMNRLFAAYIKNFTSYEVVYGAFAALPIFLLWLYLCWLVVLVGAVLAASLSRWKAGAWRHRSSPERCFYGALRALRLLYEAQRAGGGLSLEELHAALPLGLDELEDILDRLSHARIAAQLAENRHVLTRSPEQVKLADIYRLFVLGDEKPHWQPAVADLETVSNRVTQCMEEKMQIPLTALFAGREQG
jgi:membrane protein